MSMLMIVVAFASSVVMLAMAVSGGGVFAIVLAAFFAFAGFMLAVARRTRRDEIDGHRPAEWSPSIGGVSPDDLRKVALALGVLSLGMGLYELVYGPVDGHLVRLGLFGLAEDLFGKRADPWVSLVLGIGLVKFGISSRK